MDTKKTPLAVAIFAEVMSVFCLLSIVFFPSISRTVFESWFHGYNIGILWAPSFTILGIIIRLISIFVFTYIGTWIFVKIYQAIVK